MFRIFLNLLSLLTGHVLSKLVSFGCLIVLARRLGVTHFGVYGTVMAYLTLFSALADGGLTTLIIRDVSQNRENRAEYFSHALALRFLLTGLAYGIMLIIAGIGGSSPFSWHYLVIGGLFLFPEALRKLTSSLLTAYERMEIVAGLELLTTLLRYLPFFAMLAWAFSLQRAFALLAVIWCVGAGIWLLAARKICGSPLVVGIHIRDTWAMFVNAFPMGVFSMLAIIYFKADILMLSAFRGAEAVGLYDSAYRFIEAAMFVPASLATVLLPSMSRNAGVENPAYSRKYMSFLRLLAIGILPVMLGISLYAGEIMLLVYGEAYLPAAVALRILIWGLFFMFLNAPVGNLLAATDLMWSFLPYAVGNTLLNILLNIVLIPRYSFAGAGIATVLTEITGFFSQLYFAHKILKNARPTLIMLGKLLLAGFAAGGFFLLTKPYLFFPFTVCGTLLVYTGSVRVLRIITPDDRIFCQQILKRVNL